MNIFQKRLNSITKAWREETNDTVSYRTTRREFKARVFESVTSFRSKRQRKNK